MLCGLPRCGCPSLRYLTKRARVLYYKAAVQGYNELFGDTMQRYIDDELVPQLKAKGFDIG